jgi:hypothetical protein
MFVREEDEQDLVVVAGAHCVPDIEQVHDLRTANLPPIWFQFDRALQSDHHRNGNRVRADGRSQDQGIYEREHVPSSQEIVRFGERSG